MIDERTLPFALIVSPFHYFLIPSFFIRLQSTPIDKILLQRKSLPRAVNSPLNDEKDSHSTKTSLISGKRADKTSSVRKWKEREEGNQA